MCSYGAALFALSVVVAGAGAQQQAKAQRQAGETNAAIANQNKKIADLNAQDALNQGAADAAEKRTKTRLILGQQRAAIAANNVELSTGTALEVLGDTALFGATDEQRLRENASRRAWGFQVQGQNAQWQGQMDQFRGQQGAQSTYLNAASNILGTTSSYKARRG